MKLQIRRNVFETNSSSTHSLQLSNKSLEEVKEYVNEQIKNKYNDKYDNSYSFDEERYIDDNVFLLLGFNIEGSDESSCVYYIIKNWIAKIQYIAMLLDGYIWRIDGYDMESKNDIMNVPVFKRFGELIKEYAKSKGINIDKVIYGMQNDTWVENFKFNDKEFLDDKITVERLEDLFNTIMKDDCILTYSDEAYSPYISPSIYII